MNLLRELLPDELPREKLFSKGAHTLSEVELIAILLRTGNKEKNVVELARELLRNSTLDGLSKKNPEEIAASLGKGNAKLSTLVAAFELHKRLNSCFAKRGIPIMEAKDVFNYLRTKCSKQEKLFVLYLDTRQRVIKCEEITKGSLNCTLFPPKEIFFHAITNSAAGIVIAHNHPSRDVSPSGDDVKLTQQLVEAGKFLDITVIDHVIFSEDGYFSLHEHNYC